MVWFRAAHLAGSGVVQRGREREKTAKLDTMDTLRGGDARIHLSRWLVDLFSPAQSSFVKICKDASPALCAI